MPRLPSTLDTHVIVGGKVICWLARCSVMESILFCRATMYLRLRKQWKSYPPQTRLSQDTRPSVILTNKDAWHHSESPLSISRPPSRRA